MINVSNEFKAAMSERRDFRCHAEVTFADGELLTLSDADFTVSNNSITDAAGANTLPLGYAISRSIGIELLNDEGQYAERDFFGASIRLYLSYELSAGVEHIEMGTFTVTEPSTYGDTVTVTAVDDMWRADKVYTASISFPATLSELYRDVCSSCGIPFSTSAFQNSAFVVDAMPEGKYTCREIIGYIAMIAGGNARINRQGQCEILSYDFGGEAHEMGEWINLRADTNDITVTGVSSSAGDETVTVGTDGYVISIDNPFIKGREEDALPLLGERLIGARFRKFEGDCLAYPTAEFMDNVVITDRRGNTYRSVITDMNFVFFGMTTLSCSAESAVRVGSTYSTPVTGAVQRARELVAQERTARETAQAELARKIEASGGMYSTEEKQSDGSMIYYLHDKPTVAESGNVIRAGSEAIGFSTDGGKTYPYGLTVDGDVIAKILSAEGVNGDWIQAGTVTAGKIASKSITSDKLSVTSLSAITANLGTVTAGVIQSGNYVKSSTGMRLDLSTGAWDSANFKITSTGAITATSGEIGGWTIGTDGLSYSAALSQVAIRPVKDNTESAVFYVRTRASTSDAWTFPFYVHGDGYLVASNASITGTVTATGGKIATWSIDNNSIYDASVSYASSTFISTGTTGPKYAIGGAEAQTGWVIGAGGKFGVTKSGSVYCSALSAQGYIIGGSWGAGKTTTQLNDLGVCIVSASNTYTTSGQYRGWALQMNSSHALVAVPVVYAPSSDTWYPQTSKAVKLADWASVGTGSGGGSSGSGGGSGRLPTQIQFS